MTQHYYTVVEVNTEPVTIQPGAIEAEQLVWEAVQARRLKNAYLEANLTSFERYREAKVARNASAMARQAEAMIQFADLALQTSRMATLKWFEVERLFESAFEKAQAELASKGLSWDEMLVRWHETLKKEGVSTELRNALITAQLTETEIDRFGERLKSLTPERIKEVLTARREQLEAAASVREQLAQIGSEASWPEPPDIGGLELLCQKARRLFQRLLDTHIVLSPGPRGKAPLAWWAIPAGLPPRLRKESAFDAPTSGPLAPGDFDIYIVQDQESLNRPIPVALRIARELQVKEGQTTELHLQTGLELSLGEAYTKPLSWSVMASDASATSIIAQRVDGSLDMLWLPPGQYDVYWVQDNDHRDKPMLVASGVTVPDTGIVRVVLDSGIRLEVADWVPERDPNWGWWGAVEAGEPVSARVNWTKTTVDLLLPPGQYDVYWVQDNDHRDKPMLVASGVTVPDTGIVRVVLDSGIRLEIADWVPERDPNYGWWGAARAGEPTSKRVNWTKTARALLLPPGLYDVYWVQDNDHRDNPLLLAGGIEVMENTPVTLPAKSGLRLKVPATTLVLDANYGWWGVVPTGGKVDKPTHWAKGKFDEALLVPPGTYDIVWKQNYNHQSEKVKESVEAQENVLLEVDVQPPRMSN